MWSLKVNTHVRHRVDGLPISHTHGLRVICHLRYASKTHVESHSHSVAHACPEMHSHAHAHLVSNQIQVVIGIPPLVALVVDHHLLDPLGLEALEITRVHLLHLLCLVYHLRGNSICRLLGLILMLNW